MASATNVSLAQKNLATLDHIYAGVDLNKVYQGNVNGKSIAMTGAEILKFVAAYDAQKGIDLSKVSDSTTGVYSGETVMEAFSSSCTTTDTGVSPGLGDGPEPTGVSPNTWIYGNGNIFTTSCAGGFVYVFSYTEYDLEGDTGGSYGQATTAGMGYYLDFFGFIFITDS
ncbi:MAG: hypothetical protein ACYDCK_14295, partial [Thermoplasmatota archaeon]